MASRRPNWRAIKRHRSYTAEEAAVALGVSIGSVRRWMKNELPHLNDQRPFLIQGVDLIDFLQRRHKPRRRCAPQHMFCFRCREPKSADGGMIDFVPKTPLAGQLTGLCETCGTIMHKNYSAAKLGLLEKVADVSFPLGDPRLNDRANPR